MSQLSDQVLALATTYLGPAAKVFLERQTTGHLAGLKFDSLEKQHLAELSKWIATSGALVIDKAKAKELADKVAKM